MKRSLTTISEKITLLNQTILDSMVEKNSKEIVRDFTETGIRILGADFGFAWWKFKNSGEYALAYKSPNTPYNPTLPRKRAGNYIALKTKKPFFDSKVEEQNYEFNISRYLKSYIIIPIYHKNHIYGNIVLCYKKPHSFSKEELTLAQAIGHTTAQAITIHRLVKTEILLHQEKLKTEFIANATHELRTPLAIMKGNIDLANGSGKGAPRALKKALSEVNYEVSHLSKILADLEILVSEDKNLSQMLVMKPVKLVPLIEDITKRLRAVSQAKNISIRAVKGKKANFLVQGDEKYLEKLFLNLIKNAITYGRKDGQILIETAQNKNKLEIRVSDNGIGISKEDLPRIFDRFYRADKAHTGGGNHSGLGLAIAKWVVEAHGGTLGVKSKGGEGSTFTVTLPLINKIERINPK